MKRTITAIVESFRSVYQVLVRRYIAVRNKAILLNHRRRTLVRVEKHNKVPRLIMSERYEQTAKWVLRAVTMIGILLSVIMLPLYWNLTVSILLAIIEQIVERIGFQYYTIFIQPLPLEWDGSRWLSMVYMRGQTGDHLGMLIDSENQAIKLSECLRAWNYNEDEDTENNIVVSFVLENENLYTVFIYPSFRRRIIEDFRQFADDYEIVKKRQIREQQQIIISVCFCKRFETSPKSAFFQYIRDYRNDHPYALTVFVKYSTIDIRRGASFHAQRRHSPIQPLHGVRPIIKRHITVKKRSELAVSDFEFQYSQLIIGE